MTWLSFGIGVAAGLGVAALIWFVLYMKAMSEDA